MKINMKKKFFTYLIVVITIYAFNSCDNVLDQSPVDSFTEESLFQDLNLVEAFLFQCYDNMGGGHEEVLGCREDLLSSSTDETLNIHRAGNVTFTKGTLSPDYLGHFGDSRYQWIRWESLYGNIKNVNTLLDGINNVPLNTDADRERQELIKAEAYFIRAFDYINLLRSYGGVILVDHKFLLGDDYSTQTRTSLEKTVEFILSDLDKAIEGLPVKDNMEQGRATKGAAVALKIRLLSFISGELTNGGYEPSNPLVSIGDNKRTTYLTEVKNLAKQFIDGNYGHYALTGSTDDPPAEMTDEIVMQYANNYANVFLQKGQWNDEVIFGVQYLMREGNRINNNLYWGPNGYHCWGNNEPIETIVRKFEMKDGSPFIWDKYNPGEMNVRAFTQAQYEEDPERNPYIGREPRFYASVLYDGAPWRERPSTNNKVQIGHNMTVAGADIIGKDAIGVMKQIQSMEAYLIGGEDSRSASNQAWNGTKTGYYLRKMLDIEIDGETQSNENAWIEMRFAEVLLDYAEACIELGDVSEGMDAVNMIRNRAGLPDRPTNVDQAQAREWYRHERLIEMFGEGDRWYCIRKWMIAEDVITSFHPMYIYHFNDGVSVYVNNINTFADTRTFNKANYWLPISREEIKKAPQIQQNPGYN
jgi:hypothetical protein